MSNLQEPWDKLVNTNILNHCTIKEEHPREDRGPNTIVVKLSTSSADIKVAQPIVYITYKLELSGRKRMFRIYAWNKNIVTTLYDDHDAVKEFWYELNQFASDEKNRIFNEKMDRMEALLNSIDL